MEKKEAQLKSILSSMKNLLVAFSGGVDSTLLLKIAQDVLGDQVTAVIVTGPTLPEKELHQAREIATELGIPLVEMESQEMGLPEFQANTTRRCYFCKDHRYKKLKIYAKEHNFQTIIDGGNADDLSDHRPGQKAALEQGIRSPLQEAGFTKQDIRTIAKKTNLPNWDKPSSACLASRIPYGTEITPKLLNQVEGAEDFLADLGFNQLRVRHHGNIARIEIPQEVFNQVLSHREEILTAFKNLGFTYTTLDLNGFRSGSMNEVI